VALLALIAGTVSYLHMHTLVVLHVQPGWVAVLTPLSVGRTMQHANHAHVIAGDPLPLRLPRSKGKGGTR